MRRLVTSMGALLLVTLIAVPAFPAPTALVQTDAGPVRGITAAGVTSWKGIPYAAPPVGDLRWRMPQPVKPWQDARSADQFGPSCMQAAGRGSLSEDCLTLNVWRPADATGPLPVMVWIHGGALVRGGTAIYPAGALAKRGVVVVSMNYRMGRLGFFAHPALAAEAPADVRGNYGFMDQRAALEWVQRNIAAFGGDPNAVTIFGESAGGGSVMVHLTSPMSRSLFQRAILQSPGIPTARARVIPLTDLAAAETMAVEYARSVGVTGDGPTALQALLALPATTLIAGASGEEVLAGLSSGTPVVGVAGAIRDGRLVVEAPEVALAAGRQAMVPVVVGANDRDLWIGAATSKDDLFARFGPDAARARTLYDPLGNQTLDELKQQVLADETLVEPARHLADEMARAGQPVWLYRFAYVSQAQRGKNMGTLHGLEIPFALNIPSALVGDAVTPTDEVMADLTSAYWAQFGMTADPNGGGRPVWPRHDPSVDRIMHFTNEGIIVGTDPLRPRLDLWQGVWERTK